MAKVRDQSVSGRSSEEWDTTRTVLYKTKFTGKSRINTGAWKIVYTDGAKSEAGVGAAAVVEAETRTASLPAAASVFTTELHAIRMAFNIIKEIYDR